MGVPPQGFKSLFHPSQHVMIWMPTKHMGNLLVALESIRQLELSVFPCHCSLVVDESYRDIIEASQLRSEPIYYPRQKIDATHLGIHLSETLDFIRRIRHCKPDIAIAIEGDKVSQRFIPLSGNRLSIGPDNRHCKKFSIKIPLDHDQQHRFYDYAAIGQQLGHSSYTINYAPLVSSHQATNFIQKIIDEESCHPGAPFIILHPGATKKYKQWPLEFFAQLADELNELKINVIITGAGNSDGKTIAELGRLAKSPLLSLHNRLSIDKLIALSHQALFFLGNDTGPTHLAAATGTNTYAIFGPTDEKRWGPIGNNVTILRSSFACNPDCSRKQCSAEYRCMNTLTPETVKAKLPEFKTLTHQTKQQAHDFPVERSVVRSQPRLPVIMHVLKRYTGNYPLLNSMVAVTPGKYRTIVCYMSGEDDGNNGVIRHGAETIYLNLSKKNITWRHLPTTFTLKKVIDQYHIDLLICQFRRTIPIGALASRLSSSRPSVAAILHGIVRGHNTLGEKLVNFIITPIVNLWISVSIEGIRDIFEQNLAIPQERICAVQNGLDYTQFTLDVQGVDLYQLFSKSSGNERIYLTVGRLSKKKNQEKIIKAFRILVNKQPASLLVIVGSGSLLNYLKSLTHELGLEHNIVFTGFRKDVPALLRSADVFLMPSLREGLPLALLEAMASGLPPITSDINGMREVIAGIDCGWLVNPTNTESIAKALISASETTNLQLYSMGDIAKNHAINNFSRGKMVSNYEYLFDNLLQQRCHEPD